MDKDIDVWKQRNEILHKKVSRQMDEIKKLNEKSETIFDLARKYPNKTYVELEKYRDADRVEEAIGIGHNLPPDEGEEQENPTLWQLAKKHNVSYANAIPIQEDMRLKRDALKAACTIGEMRKDRTPLEQMKKRAEEAEGELSIMKGIETNRVKEAQARCDHLQSELDRVKKDNNDLFLRIAELTEVEESHRNMNGKLQERLTEVEEDNKKLSSQIEDKINALRKSGM
jgi:predicted  nucleic acid-binding Zn-ribbon protein